MLGNKQVYSWFCGCFIIMNVFLSQMVFASEITVYTYQHVPFAEQTDTTHQGLIIDIIDEMFSRAEIEYKVVFNPLKRGLTMTKRSHNVCVLPIVRTQQKESDYRWVGPVLISRYGLFSSKSQAIPLVTLQDAKPLSIGTYLGSGISEYLTSFRYQVQVTNDDALNIKKLERNRIDLWAAELISAQALMRQSKIQLGEPELIFHTSLRAMACNETLDKDKHDALVNALNTMYQDGFMAKLNREYGVLL
ncbi:substrate-binding periplasmic protein [Shewanella goraebulensis]|uniref:substrate-binding periplasmic protein n=1 Tax=Shewanella goraebulensis TaxID=3050637 RepID=UPI00254E691D|nr:transporter substrate-binding domain-containing protein [Shewanella goraebulensis]